MIGTESMRQAARRLRALEAAVATGRRAIIPPDQRWWCALCETEAERQVCMTEPVTRADIERAWHAALDEVTHDQGIEAPASA